MCVFQSTQHSKGKEKGKREREREGGFVSHLTANWIFVWVAQCYEMMKQRSSRNKRFCATKSFDKLSVNIDNVYCTRIQMKMLQLEPIDRKVIILLTIVHITLKNTISQKVRKSASHLFLCSVHDPI